MSRKTWVAWCVVSVLLAGSALACLWDSDTLQMERLRFPGVLEIITGKFVRHSQAYYVWRIADRTKKLEAKPGDPALIDDLAVAYAKLGRPEEGIPLLEEVLKQHPDRYETLSNLGTLLFFANRLDDSKTYIRRALDINPDAHFGRERYQSLLTEYLQQSNYVTTGVMRSDQGRGFDDYVLKARPLTARDEIKEATTGVLGMMHFADFQSPILLEAVGDLLRHGMPNENMTQLAARAYLSASQYSSNKDAANRFREFAQEALRSHEEFGMFRDDVDLAPLRRQLSKEITSANKWFDSIAANEKRWIAENRDVDREFAAIYYDSLDSTLSTAEKQVQREWQFLHPSYFVRLAFEVLAVLFVLPTMTVAIVFTWRHSRRKAVTRERITS
jgi:tetratricopeptide (TPR) repeat protein